MDIDLLSKMVKELILDNDKVVLPGLGVFVAEIVPSAFSDKGYTINPPYRRLYFRSKPDEGIALIDFYAKSNKVDRDIADKVIRDFISELREVLFVRKTVVFPGLGRLRATKENTVFFIADEDLDIYPDGFALEPISLKTHVETQEEVAAVIEGLKTIVNPVVGPSAESDDSCLEIAVTDGPETMETVAVNEGNEGEIIVPAEGAADTVAVEQSKSGRNGWKVFAKVVMWLAVAAVVLLVAFVMISRFAPDITDRLLYTPEELEIIMRK